MQSDLSYLEKAWLHAEALADEARTRALQMDRQLETVKKKAAAEELKILLSTVESARAAHAQAEQMACDAFEQLWQAKSQGTPRGQPQEQMNA
jgi:hypothetical protein